MEKGHLVHRQDKDSQRVLKTTVYLAYGIYIEAGLLFY